MNRTWAVLLLASLAGGCGRMTEHARHPYLISEDEAWRVARDTLESVCAWMEKGNLESFHRSLSLRARERVDLPALQADYLKNRAEFVRRSKGVLVLRVLPPSVDQPYVDMTVRHSDGIREIWRLIYEEDRWRIDRMGRSILEVEGAVAGS